MQILRGPTALITAGSIVAALFAGRALADECMLLDGDASLEIPADPGEGASLTLVNTCGSEACDLRATLAGEVVYSARVSQVNAQQLCVSSWANYQDREAPCGGMVYGVQAKITQAGTDAFDIIDVIYSDDPTFDAERCWGNTVPEIAEPSQRTFALLQNRQNIQVIVTVEDWHRLPPLP